MALKGNREANKKNGKQQQVYEALHESESRLNALVTATSDVVYIMSHDWKQMYSLKGGKFLTSVEAPIDDWFNNYIPMEAQSMVWETIQKAIDTKSKFELEHQVISIDGTIGWTLSRAIPLMDEHGEIVEWIGIASDFTDRKNAENALRKSETRMKALIKATSNAIYRMSPNWDTLELLSGDFFNEVENQPYKPEEYIPADDLPRVLEAIAVAIQNKSLFDLEHQVYLPSGRKGWTLSKAIPLLDEKGEIEEWFGFAEDITKRVQSEQALRQSEELFSKAFDNIQVPALIMRCSDNTLTDVNSIFLEIFDYSRSDVIGNTTKDLLVFANNEERAKAAGILKKLGFLRNNEFEMNTKSGKKFILLLSSVAVTIHEEKHVLTTFYDITELKKTQEALRLKEREEAIRAGAENAMHRLNEELMRSNKELEQFAYLTSHDLQEPLRKISTFTELLSRTYKGHFNEEGEQIMRYIIQSSHRMRSLVNDLQTYSMIGSSALPFTKVDFNDVFKNVVNALAIFITEKNAIVTCSDLPTILGDESQLLQLLRNLIENSLKFCIKIPEIHVSSIEEHDHYLFSVSDNGIGIDYKYASKIFLIFQRLVNRNEYTGTGIGLAICKRIVERHGGKIFFESNLNEGSTFYFTIAKNHYEYGA